MNLQGIVFTKNEIEQFNFGAGTRKVFNAMLTSKSISNMNEIALSLLPVEIHRKQELLNQLKQEVFLLMCTNHSNYTAWQAEIREFPEMAMLLMTDAVATTLGIDIDIIEYTIVVLVFILLIIGKNNWQMYYHNNEANKGLLSAIVYN